MKLPEITLDWLREKNACDDCYKYYAKVKTTDPIALLCRLIDDNYSCLAEWLVVQIMDHKQKISYAAYAAEIVLPIFEKKYPGDMRPRKAIEAARSCLTYEDREDKIIFATAAARAADCAADCAANAGSNDSCSAASAAYTAARAARAVTSSAEATHAARAAYYSAGSYANEYREEAYSKILAYGMELLLKGTQ